MKPFHGLSRLVLVGAFICMVSCDIEIRDRGGELEIDNERNHGNRFEHIDIDQHGMTFEEAEEVEDVQEEGGGDEEMIELPENTEEEALARLNVVDSLDGFVSLLYTENGEKVTPDDIFSKYESEDGKRVIHTGGRMAEPDECSPRNTTVYLRMNSTDSREIFYPRCTKIERCGGCCSTPHLKCVSAYTERIVLMVVKARVSKPGSRDLYFNGVAPVVVDRHIRCHVRCSLTAEKCGEKKTFLPHPCICKCKTYLRCIAPQIFSSDTCECECPGGVQECCKKHEPCPYVFNKRSCSCEVDSGKFSMNNKNFTLANETELDGDSITEGKIDRVICNRIKTTQKPTTTTAAKATTAKGSFKMMASAKADPCTKVLCPTSFRHVVYGGTCMCRPTGRFRKRRPSSKDRPTGKSRWTYDAKGRN